MLAPDLPGTHHPALRASFLGKESVLFFGRRWTADSLLISLALAGVLACADGANPPARQARARPANSGSQPAAAASVTDDFGDTIRAAHPAQRIVSLSPVTTELLFALGAGGRVVGRTHWDLSPAAAAAVDDVGNGMQPNVEAVLGVHPDLVVLYASPSNRAAATQLRRVGVNTLAIRDDHISDFRRTVAMLARVTGDTLAGVAIVDSVERSLASVRERPRPAKPPTVFWHMWDSPIVTIGAGSYLDELVTIAGAKNVFGDRPEPSPQVTLEEIVRRNPDFILVGPASAKALRDNALWRAVPAVRDGRLLIVDTLLTARPGVRLGEAAHSLRALILNDTVR
jgi:ABC-type Fe3+-hydroxamate transport system substrate-binding protein